MGFNNSGRNSCLYEGNIREDKDLNNSEVKNINMKTYLSLLLVIFLVLPMVSAADSDFVIKQNDCLHLVQFCALCTQNNISSVLFPDTTEALGLVQMQKSGTNYNYTFCNTNVSGIYTVNGIGDLEGDGVGVVWRYTFEVNPTGGLETNTTIFIIFILCATGLLLLSFLFKNYVFAVIAGFTYLLTGVYTMINGFGFVTSANTQMLSIIIIGFGAIIAITSGLEFSKISYNQGEDFDD